MGKQNHIIQKLVLEIGLPRRDDAFTLQSKLTNEHEKLVLHTMCEVFDKHIGEEEILEIDKLEINVGNFTPENIDREFPEKIKKAIEEKILHVIFEMRKKGGIPSEIQIETRKGITITAKGSLKNRMLTRLETLFYILEFGTLPWRVNEQEKVSLPVLLAEAMEHSPEVLKKKLWQLSGKTYVFRRLALQVESSQLAYLAAVMDCGFSSMLVKDIETIIAWTKSFAKAKSIKQSGITISSTEAYYFLWEKTIALFSSVDGNSVLTKSRSSEIVFIQYLFEQLVVRFNIIPESDRVKYMKVYSGTVVDKAIKEVIKQYEIKNPPRKKNTPANTDESLDNKKKLSFEAELNEILLKEKVIALTEEELIRKKELQFLLEEIVKKEKEIAQQEELILLRKKQEEEEKLPEVPDADEGIYIENAGMVILAPYLAAFFENISLVKDKAFISEEAKWKAVHILQWLVHGDITKTEEQETETGKENTEHQFSLNKIFCGMELSEPVPTEMELSKEEKEECDNLLQAVIQNWPLLKRSSIYSLRVTFLEKEGRLKRQGGDWHLYIHRDSAVDVLIDRLPWTISVIKLPWMKEYIHTEW